MGFSRHEEAANPVFMVFNLSWLGAPDMKHHEKEVNEGLQR
jgi:hypothetical protein